MTVRWPRAPRASHDSGDVFGRVLLAGPLLLGIGVLGGDYAGRVQEGVGWPGAARAVPTTVLGLESDLQGAAATLAAAGLFVPVRRRVQAVVDRRFDRARYDAQRVVERFGSRMRDELDLDTLLVALHGVVGTTVRPAFVTLWRRPGLRYDVHRAGPRSRNDLRTLSEQRRGAVASRGG